MASIAKNNEGLEHGKCIDCGACGISGCCPPLDCKMTNNCKYCKEYLQELKYAYTCYSKMYKLIYDNQKKYPELFEEVENIRDDAEPSIDLGNIEE